MTKKEFIWLGIRVIGLYWLIILLQRCVQVICISGAWTLSSFRSSGSEGSYISSFIVTLTNIPVPLALTVYFLCFGGLIYKFINSFVTTRPEDLSKPKQYVYCETIIRFIGLWCISMIISYLFSILWLPLRSELTMYFSHPERLQQQNLWNLLVHSYSVNLTMITISLLCSYAFGIWYFLKHGKLFINMLNRCWLKPFGSEAIQQKQGVIL